MKRTALSVAISLLLLGTTPHEALALYVEEQPATEAQSSGDTSQPVAQPSPSGPSAQSQPTTASEPTTQTRPTTESEPPPTESTKPTSSEPTTESEPATPSGPTTVSGPTTSSGPTTTTSGPTTTSSESEAATQSGPTTVSEPTTPSGPTTTTTTSDKPTPSGPTTTTTSGPTTTSSGNPTQSGPTTTTTSSGNPTQSGPTTTTTTSGKPTQNGQTTTTTTSAKPTQNGQTTTTTTSGKPTQSGPTTTTTTSGKPTQSGPTTTTTTSGKPTTSGPTTTASEGGQASNSGTTNNTPCNCSQSGQTTQSGKPQQGKPVAQTGQTTGSTSQSGKQPSQGGQAQPGGQPSQTGQSTDQAGQASTCEKPHQGKHPSRPCNKPHRPKLQDFGIAPEQVEKFSQLSPEALQAFSAHQMGRVPPKAFKEMAAQQMMELPKEAVSGLTPEQFQEMPPEALQGLTADNMAGLSPEVIGKFKPKHFAKLDHQQFQQMPGKGIGKLLTQCDSTEVKPEDVKDLLPADWKLNQDDGTLQPPAGTQLALPTKKPSQQSSQVKLPQNIPDFGKGFGVGGRHPAGHSVLTGLNQGLAQAGYPQFTFQQNDQGILTVKGSAEFQGMDLTFIPGKDMTQADETATTGLSTDDSGQYVVTTPEKQQFPVVPAPKDPAAMSDALGEQGTVEVGQEGDVLLKDPTQNQTVVGICDPVVTPAPANAKPGLHFTQQQNGKQTAQFVYKDGTMQTIHPTVPQPARFIEQTMAAFDGVEKVVHRKDDGSFDVTVNGQAWSVTPNFEVTEEALPDNEDADAVEPQVTACSQQPSCLEYTVPHDKKLLTMKLQVTLPQNGQSQQGGQSAESGQP